MVVAPHHYHDGDRRRWCLRVGLARVVEFYASEPPPEAVSVEVTGEQFAWNIRYPGQDGAFGRTHPRLISLSNPLGLDQDDARARDDIVLLNEIFLPVKRLARIRLRSKDTLHSFFLPNLRVKQEAGPEQPPAIPRLDAASGLSDPGPFLAR